MRDGGARAGRPRPRLRWRTGIAVLVLLVVVVTAGAASSLVLRGLPVIDADVRLLGLEERTEIVRDGFGVPHIYAKNAHDLFFAQGFVTAQDRLFQMDLSRRVGLGRLSEVLGEAALETDRYLRTVGLHRVAALTVARMDPETRAAAEAYAGGVNAFIAGHADALPLEFVILGYRPEAWTPVDSLVIGKLQALGLDGNYTSELLRAAIVQRVGEGALATLAPDDPRPAALDDGGWQALLSAGLAPDGAAAPTLDALPGFLGDEAGALGSNCWAVAKGRSGKPLFAGDPHLGVRNPAVWYEVSLEGAGYRIAGFSFPGVPGVIIGHNDRIAWSFTAAFTDTQDLYVEQQDPTDFHRYLFRGSYERATFVREEIRVKGRIDPVSLDVTITRHGPIMTGVLKGQSAQLALRWTALEPLVGLDSILALNRARDWSSYRAALATFPGPTVTGCYADVDGHIGWSHAGVLPIRMKGDGRMPVPGWTGEYEWAGFVPPAQHPFVLDPAEGWLVSANDRLVRDPASPTYAGEWDPGYRGIRLREELGALRQPDAEAFRILQTDIASAPVAAYRQAILASSPRTPRGLEAQAVVRAWDGVLAVDSAGAAIAEAWLMRLADRTFKDKLGETLYADYQGGRWMVRALTLLLGRPNDAWFSSQVDGEGNGLGDLAGRSLDDAVKELTSRLGADMAKWRWGDLHTITFEHQLSVAKPLNLLFDIGPLPRPGDGYSVNQAAYRIAKPFALRNHSSMRMIVDLGDLDASLSVIPTGQSGQPFARHWGDQTPLWASGRLHPMGFTRERLIGVEGTLVLRPR